MSKAMPTIPTLGVLDLGASGGRVYACSMRQNHLELQEVHRFAHAPQRVWQMGSIGLIERIYWDLGRLYEGFLEGLRALATYKDLCLHSFGVDTWGSDGAWVNADGDLLSLVATGRDPRWLQARSEIAAQISPKELFHLTAVHSDPFCVLNQIYWYTQHAPATVGAAQAFLPINSLFHYYLSGERVAELTWMTTTQMVRPGQSSYLAPVFERLALPIDKLPPLVQPGTSLGSCHTQLASYLGFQAPFQVIVPATHDTACAYIAAPTRPDRRSILVSSGTWSLVGIPQDVPLTSDPVYNAHLTNIGGVEQPYFQAVIMGTWLAQQLRVAWSQQARREISWDEFGGLARSAPPFSIVLDIDDPLFYAPTNMEEAIATYCAHTNQPLPISRAAIARAVYEGLALKTALACSQMQQLSGYQADEILIVGGGSQNPLLNQWIADASGIPVRTGSVHATALGNALIQARTLHWISDYAEGRALAETAGKEYWPEPKEDWVSAQERITAWQH